MSYADVKKARCAGCAAGWPELSMGHVRLGFPEEPPKPCTAPTEADFIVELEAKLAAAEADTLRLDWLEKVSLDFPITLRWSEGNERWDCGDNCLPGGWREADSARAAIDAAMKEGSDAR